MAENKSSKQDEKTADASHPLGRPNSADKAPVDVRVEETARGTVYHEARAEQGTPAEAIKAKNIDGDSDSHYEKTFVLMARDFGAGYDHTPNFTGTSQEAVNVGLRLTGDVEYVGKENHPDGESVMLNYRVPVIPAWHEDAPVNVVDAQEVWRDGVTPADERTPVDPEQVAPRTGDARYSEAGQDPKRKIESGAPAPGTPAAEEKDAPAKEKK